MGHNYKYIFTKLKKVFLDEKIFEEKMNFSLEIEYLLQKKNKEDKNTIVKVSGDLTSKNTKNEVAVSILMESYFETENNITEDDLKEVNDHLNKPILNEISLLLAQLTGKSLEVPIIMPLDVEE